MTNPLHDLPTVGRRATALRLPSAAAIDAAACMAKKVDAIKQRLPSAAAIDAAVRMARKIDALQQQLGVKLTPAPRPHFTLTQIAFSQADFARAQRLGLVRKLEIQR